MIHLDGGMVFVIKHVVQVSCLQANPLAMIIKFKKSNEASHPRKPRWNVKNTTAVVTPLCNDKRNLNDEEPVGD